MQAERLASAADRTVGALEDAKISPEGEEAADRPEIISGHHRKTRGRARRHRASAVLVRGLDDNTAYTPAGASPLLPTFARFL
jgi:hypothetical protein